MLTGKDILFVTTLNMSSNPRCLKEIRTLVSLGVNVTVLKFSFDNWSNKNEIEIEQKLPTVKWIKVSATRKPFAKWLISTIINNVALRLSPMLPGNMRLLAYSLDKRSVLLDAALAGMKPAYDFIIAHNPGAFWPVSSFALKNHIPFGIDVEDYHPGEHSHDLIKEYITLMQHTFREAGYLSAASPLIMEYVLDDIKTKKEARVINNVFSLAIRPDFKQMPVSDNEPLKLVWFSQHVGLNRGLQDAIEAVNLVTEFPVHLTVIGNCTAEVRAKMESSLKQQAHKIIFKQPYKEKELLEEVSNHHIGLALEPGFCINNEIALSNKILVYALAGNAIIASDTKAQQLFMKSYAATGSLYERGNYAQFARIIKTFYRDSNLLLSKRMAAYNTGGTILNWEKEQGIFIDLLTHALSDASGNKSTAKAGKTLSVN